jgi:hypothetical protein
MSLHYNKKLFSDTLRAASQHLDIKLEFVEKDYWITWVGYSFLKYRHLWRHFGYRVRTIHGE